MNKNKEEFSSFINDELMTIKECADYLKVHPLTVYRMCNKRSIPSFKIIGRWKIPQNKLNKWLDEKYDKKFISKDT